LNPAFSSWKKLPRHSHKIDYTPLLIHFQTSPEPSGFQADPVKAALRILGRSAFREDGFRLRKDHGSENMAILRKLALTVAHADTETKSSIIGRRKQMAWSNEYLERLLFQSQPTSEPG
jgi:hypothetical protein